MGLGLPLISKQTFATSTTESGNQVLSTYDYVSAGVIKLFAKGSDANVRCNLFINGTQILRNSQVFFGTTGTLSTADNLVAEVPTLGGRIELTFVATTGTPTVDFLLTHAGVPLGGAISKLFGR